MLRWTTIAQHFPSFIILYGVVNLDNGDLLICGGYGEVGPGVIQDVWRVSPNGTNDVTITHVGLLQKGKANVNVVKLADGRVLIAGGSTNSTSETDATCDIYDPNTDSVSPTGSLGTARASGALYLLPNGKALYAGGGDPNMTFALASCELYDPNTGTWSPTGAMNHARTASFFGVSGSGIPVIAGGSDGTTALSTIERYNQSGGTWSLASSTLPPGAGLVTMINSTVIQADGDLMWASGVTQTLGPGGSSTATLTTYTYNANTDVITQRGNLHLPRMHAGVIQQNDGTVIYLGGNTGLDTAPASLTSEVYSPTTHTWTMAGQQSDYLYIFGLNSWKSFTNNIAPVIGGMHNQNSDWVDVSTIQLGGLNSTMSITFVQSASIDGYPQNALTITPTVPTSTGNLLVIALVRRQPSTSFATITDSASNTYLGITASYIADGGDPQLQEEIYYCANAASATTITVTLAGGESGQIGASLYEYSGAATTGPIVDVAGSNNFPSGSMPGPSLTLTNAGDVIVTVCGTGQSISAVSSPYTNLINFVIGGNGEGVGVADLLPGTSGVVAGATFTGAINTVIGAAAFFPAPTGPTAKQKSSMFLLM